jgi:hypothetical protein
MTGVLLCTGTLTPLLIHLPTVCLHFTSLREMPHVQKQSSLAYWQSGGHETTGETELMFNNHLQLAPWHRHSAGARYCKVFRGVLGLLCSGHGGSLNWRLGTTSMVNREFACLHVCALRPASDWAWDWGWRDACLVSGFIVVPWDKQGSQSRDRGCRGARLVCVRCATLHRRLPDGWPTPMQGDNR